MDVYRITQDFYYDNELKSSHSFSTITDSPLNKVIKGSDYEGLYKLKQDCPLSVPLQIYTIRGKQFMQFYDALFSIITPKNCKSWKLEISSRKTDISMRELMSYNSDDVIKYLKERGITICPILK